MSDPVEPLIVDLLEWLAKKPRTYSEVMEAWRTSCPRLPVWEEANDRGYVGRASRDGTAMVVVTEMGRDHLTTSRASANSRATLPAA